MPEENILVVEDEKDIQELVRYNLCREGYRVTCADSGEEALKTAQSLLPDLVVLDLMLPGVDGLEVCRQMKKKPATAHSEPSLKVQVLFSTFCSSGTSFQLSGQS